MPNSTQPTRTRFAPSPTGFLHIGGARTALFAWLLARHTGGQFLLRIEDTDQKRFNPQSLDNLMHGLRWLGLDWDEGPDVGGPHGPYVQSERRDLYRKYAEQLIAGGHAYRAYETPEELTAIREDLQKRGLPPGYNRQHRHLSDEERAAFEAEGRPSVVRLSVPEGGSTTVHDLIRGEITTEHKQLQDAVLLKADGLPTYHLAVVVDDHLMQITHVLRAEEWIPSAPLHKLIADALGIELPTLVHLPVILNPGGKGKLSKRKQAGGEEHLTLVHEFIEAGYLPDALFNYLTNVGWNFDPEREIFTRQEAIERFDPSEINPSPAALNYEKLAWMNGMYIRELSPEALKQALVPVLADALDIDPAVLRVDPRLDPLIPAIQERLKTLNDAPELVDWAFKQADELVYDDPKLLLGRKLDAAQSIDVLRSGSVVLGGVEPFEAEPLEAAFRQAADDAGLKAGSYFGPFRAAISAKQVSPPLFESMAAIGREEVLRRVERAIGVLEEIGS